MHYFRMHDDIMMPGDYPGAWEIYSHGMHLPKANRNNLVKLGGVCGNKEKKTEVVINFTNGKVLYADAYWKGMML